MVKHQQTQLTPKQLPFWRQIRWSLVLAFVLVSLVPIVLTGTIILSRQAGQIEEQIFDQLNTIAELKKDQIDFWLESEIFALNTFVADPARNLRFVQFVQESLEPGQNIAVNENLNDLLAATVAESPQFTELFVYNNQGQIIASSDPVQIGKLVTGQPYFEASLVNEDYIQKPYYEIGTNELTMLTTHPFVAQGETIGALAGRLNLNTLSNIMTERTGLGESNETYLVSRENNYFLTPSYFEGYPLTRAYRSQGIDQVLQGKDGFGLYDDYRSPAVPVFGVYRWIPDLEAGLIAEIDQAEALAPFNQSQAVTLLLIAVTIVMAIGAGVFVATRISRPIVSLTGVATQIAAGDIEQQAVVTQQNEIGLLADAFNSMTAQLRNFIASLEDRVAERTQRLETVAGIGEQVSAILELEPLLHTVVEQTQNQFGYYHVHIYLLDESSNNLVVAEGTGSAGAVMKENRHSIALNAPTSLVAQAARTGQIVRVDNVRQNPDWLPNDLLPNTHAEMAVPIILNNQVAGVLDVQADKVGGLDESDAGVLRFLANQVAVAIRNAQLFQEVEDSLDQARQAQARYTDQAWGRVAQNRAAPQYLYTQPAAPPLSEDILHMIEVEALRVDEPAFAGSDDHFQSVAAPVKLDNQIVGTLQMHRLNQSDDTELTWTEEDLQFVQAVLEQVAQTAENLRLFDETRQRASQEQATREIAEKMQQAPDLEGLVKIAADELGRYFSLEYAAVELGIEQDET